MNYLSMNFINYVNGDLFASKSPAFAHCVSVDLQMSKGIAKKFIEIYGGMEEFQMQKKQIGLGRFYQKQRKNYFLPHN